MISQDDILRRQHTAALKAKLDRLAEIQYAKDEGIDEGIEKGTLAPLVHLYRRRLGRPLSEEEHNVLQQRLATLGADRLSDLVLDVTEADALEAWLKDPGAR